MVKLETTIILKGSYLMGNLIEIRSEKSYGSLCKKLNINFQTEKGDALSPTMLYINGLAKEIKALNCGIMCKREMIIILLHTRQHFLLRSHFTITI